MFSGTSGTCESAAASITPSINEGSDESAASSAVTVVSGVNDVSVSSHTVLVSDREEVVFGSEIVGASSIGALALVS